MLPSRLDVLQDGSLLDVFGDDGLEGPHLFSPVIQDFKTVGLGGQTEGDGGAGNCR